jgi:hypothetical protein
MATKKSDRVVEAEFLRDANGVATGLKMWIKPYTPLEYVLSEMEPQIVAEAACHGLKQKTGDAAAMSKDENGEAASDLAKYGAMRDVHQRLTGEDAQWNARAGGGGPTGGLIMLATAVLEVVKRDVPEATLEMMLDDVKGWDRKTQYKMRFSDPEVSPVYARLKAEEEARQKKAAESMVVEQDTGSLLKKTLEAMRAKAAAKAAPAPNVETPPSEIHASTLTPDQVPEPTEEQLAAQKKVVEEATPQEGKKGKKAA